LNCSFRLRQQTHGRNVRQGALRELYRVEPAGRAALSLATSDAFSNWAIAPSTCRTSTAVGVSSKKKSGRRRNQRRRRPERRHDHARRELCRGVLARRPCLRKFRGQKRTFPLSGGGLPTGNGRPLSAEIRRLLRNSAKFQNSPRPRGTTGPGPVTMWELRQEARRHSPKALRRIVECLDDENKKIRLRPTCSSIARGADPSCRSS
jgi:hypothetical protein